MRANEQESYLKQYYWTAVSTITSAQALLGADALTHAAVKALADTKKAIFTVPQGWLAGEFRFYSNAADSADVAEVYLAASTDSKPDHYRHVGQLTTTAGTQEYGSFKFIDTIVHDSKWLTRNEAVSPANNTFGSYVMNFHGNNKVLFILSTLGSTTFGVEVKKV